MRLATLEGTFHIAAMEVLKFRTSLFGPGKMRIWGPVHETGLYHRDKRLTLDPRLLFRGRKQIPASKRAGVHVCSCSYHTFFSSRISMHLSY